MTVRQKSKKLSKDSILSEAKRLFSSKGYRGTTLRDLTGSFGVSRPSLYYYYKSKMDLLSELHAQGFNKAGERFDEILQAEAPTKEKFRKILGAHINNLASDINLHKIYYMDEMEMPEKLRREIRGRRRGYTDKIIGIYKKGIEEGIFKDIDPKVAVYLLLGACNWLVMWYAPKKQIKPKSIAEYLITILSEGYEKKDLSRCRARAGRD